MTRRIVTEHAGTIDVHSEPGKGTCFMIYLPLSGSETEAGES
jgi:signal transduction histidine kinase